MADDKPSPCPDCGYVDPAGDQGQNCPNCGAGSETDTEEE